MADRRVKVVFSAEIQNFKSSMEAAAQATSKAKTASEAAGKAADKSAAEIAKQALAHHEAAKAAGLQYDNTGQLVTMNGRAVTSQQAATHGLQTFSQEAYLAGRAAVSAGEDSEKAARAAAEAEAKAAAAIEKRREALERVGAIAIGVGVATLAGVGMAVKSYADFDKQMSSVDAATHETAGNMQLLRDAAISAGADTAFSAVEAAKGIEEMAKAGVSTKDILGGGLAGALALAAAGSLDVGTAAELASSALTQFKLKGSDLPHVADLMAAGAGKAQGSVEDLGMALNQSGLIASQTGLTIEETTGGLAAFASAGLTGSDAGTSFKTMLQALTPNSAKAATAMSELGISAYDSQGNFVGLSEFAGQLKNSLSGLTAEQRNTTLETIFGSDAVRAAAVLYEQGSEGVQKWEDAVNDAGFAAETAARMQDNLAGDLEKLGGAFDTALIQSGSGANEVLRGLVQGLEGVVDAVGKVPAPVLGAVTGLAALVGGAALIGGTLITVIPKIRDTRDALNELAPAGGKARSGLSTAAKVAERAAAAFAAVAVAAKLASDATDNDRAKTSVEGFNNALDGVATRGDAAKKALDGAFNGVTKPGSSSFTAVNDLDSALKRVFNPQFNDNMNDFWSTVTGNNATSGMNVTKSALSDLDKSISSMAKSGNLEDAAAGFSLAAKAAKDQGVPIEKLVELFPEYKDAILAAKTANGETQVSQESLTEAMLKADPAADKAAVAIEKAGAAAEISAAQAEEIEKALEDVGLAANGSVTDIDKFTASLFNAGLLSLSTSDAAIRYQDSIDALTESVAVNGKTLDINTEQGRANQSAFNGIAQSAIASAEAMATETLKTQGSAAAQAQLQGALRTSYDDLVAAAGQLGIVGDEADTMARKALGVPKNVNIDAWIADHASGTLDGIKSKTEGLDGKTATVTVFTREIIQKSIEEKNVDEAFLNDVRKRATGGILRGYSDGGQLPSTGPGTGVTDGFLGISSAGVPVARLDANEWIINGHSSNRYNRELAAINAGTFPKLPGYASGGREYSAQQLGYAPYRSTAASAASVTNNWNITTPADPVVTSHEVARRQQALTT